MFGTCVVVLSLGWTSYSSVKKKETDYNKCSYIIYIYISVETIFTSNMLYIYISVETIFTSNMLGVGIFHIEEAKTSCISFFQLGFHLISERRSIYLKK